MNGKAVLKHVVLSCGLVFGGTSIVCADQGTAVEAAVEVKRPEVSPDQERIAKYLTGAKFVGKFTDDHREDATLTTEEYVIRSCEKVAGKDAFRLVARIKYGSTDGDFPIDVKIPFADKTPVITLDSIWIPGLGTFDARVAIHQGRYAGTWKHGDHGGHLFGKIIAKSKRGASDEGSDQ